MPPDQEEKPQIDIKTENVNCPNCNDPKAVKTSWTIGGVLFTSINCSKCGLSDDQGSYQGPDERN